MADEDKQIERLDSEFYELLAKIESYLFVYDFREKYILTEWLKKLKESKSTIDERKLRNRFMKHFFNNQEACINIFRSEPFNKVPKDFHGPLLGLKKLLPKDPDEAINPTEDEKRSYMSELFDNLVDKGSFLGQQPLPRRGTFYILILADEGQNPCPRPTTSCQQPSTSCPLASTSCPLASTSCPLASTSCPKPSTSCAKPSTSCPRQ